MSLADLIAIRYLPGQPDSRDWYRFWRRVEIDDDCWEFIGARRAGYGCLKVKGRTVNAHRILAEWLYGPLGAQTVDHLCMNRACVRPDHLELVSLAVNIRRARAARTLREKAVAS